MCRVATSGSTVRLFVPPLILTVTQTSGEADSLYAKESPIVIRSLRVSQRLKNFTIFAGQCLLAKIA